MKTGFWRLFGAAAWNIGHHALLPPSLPWSVLPVVCYAIGTSLSAPSIQLLVLDMFPANRGLASSLQGFTHSFLAALTAGLIAPYLAGSALTLALGQLALLVLGSLCWICYWRLSAEQR